MILAWLISGHAVVELQVGGAEVVMKMILYYLHERGWYRLDYGLKQRRKQTKKIQAQEAKD